MFYITDYITKMDIKTNEMLSLMSCAVDSVSSTPIPSDVDHAKTLFIVSICTPAPAVRLA